MNLANVGHEVIKILSQYGEAYIVGGYVRDLMTGEKVPHDLDIATNVPMDQIEKLFESAHEVGKNFGIITINYKGFQYEIAQFRQDIYETKMPEYVQKIIEE